MEKGLVGRENGTEKNQLGIGQTRDEVLGRKVMLRWGKVYRFEKNIDDIGRN